uniref:hypothetical protein n=1 Tax=Fulvivirga sp. TaxID=1931237 RepID=UPI00404B6142
MYQNIRSSFLSDQEKCIEDLERFEYLMKNEFSGYGILPNTAEFDKKLDALKTAVNTNSLKAEEFNLEIIKAVASFKDPHTAIYNKSELLTTRFPYYLTLSDGALYLQSGQVDKKWLGAKVKKIGNASSKEVIEKLSTYTNAPNEAGMAYFITSYLYSPAILSHENIISDPSEIQLEVTLDSESTELSFNSMPAAEVSTLPDYYRMKDKYSDYVAPLYRSHSGQNYWYEYLEEENLFYLRYELCVAHGDINAFWDEVFEKLNNANPDKFVIDVRDNPGGDTQNHSYFLSQLEKDTLVNRYGKLFTLIDRGTGSAAVSFASDMERMTETILVGEKTMDKPNTTSDPTFFTLPHSGVTILLPNLYSLHSHINDKRDAVIPDIPIVQNIEGDAYLIDEVMDSVKNMAFNNQAARFAKLSASMEGQYTFSAIRNASISQRDSIWHLSIDGLLNTPIYQKDSSFYTRKYNINFVAIDSTQQELTLQIHNSLIELTRINASKMSLVKSILERQFEKTKEVLKALEVNGQLPYYLDRPFFQSRTYALYNQYGFDDAIKFNEITKQFYPNDPVASIVDFELYQYEGSTLGQIKSVFPVVGKLLNRYYDIITTEKVMNDDYNAFIGK